MPKVWVSRAHLQNESLGIEVWPGDIVPAALIKASPWLVSDGLVFEKGPDPVLEESELPPLPEVSPLETDAADPQTAPVIESQT